MNFIEKSKNYWKDLSVSHKLYAVVGVMALLIATELFTLLFAMNTLSAVRALVGGEGMWSKAQKDAVLELQSYAYTHDERHYQSFLQQIQVPMGDRQARLEMQKKAMNMQIVREGFMQGRIHEDDIEPVVKLLRRFYEISYIAQALKIWEKGDDLMSRLIATSHHLHNVIQRPKSSQTRKEIRAILHEIWIINEQITVVENDFSFTLGAASRWLENLLVILLVIAVATVESTGLLLTFTFARSLNRSLVELHDFALNVGQGQLSQQLPVHSNDELGQLAMALNKMAVELKDLTGERQIAERSNQIKSLFLANMSHEIRTPLNAMLGFVDLLKDASTTRQERQKYLEIIERTGNNLATIINDILDISKVEAGKLEIESSNCNVQQIVGDLKSLLSLRCEEKGIFLNFEFTDLPDAIVTDSSRFKQILMNIIGNAIKFTDRGGVTVSLKVENDQLICEVEDTGVGIPAGSAAKLFQPFSQVDLSIRKKFGGTGLGLILSRRLANLLGGDVVLKRSEPGRGSLFVITISTKKTNALAPHRTSQEQFKPDLTPRSLATQKILVVEDSLDNQLLAQQYLLKEGAEVDIAGHGLDAIQSMGKAQYDLVLMDMQMPVMDGYTATQKLRQMGYKTPIIALTAHAMKEDLEKCLTAGCDSYISKPFRRDNLLQLVRQYCQKRAA